MTFGEKISLFEENDKDPSGANVEDHMRLP
jgi:hypothetical protein